MDHLMACRVCLAYNIRLHSISSGQLRDIYEEFTDTSLEMGDTKPTCVCYICFSLLKKFQKFIEKAKKTNQLLEEMLNFGLELSVNSLELFRKQQTGIPWTLSKTPTIRVISAIEEEVNVETPIKTEYVNSEMDMGDQNEVLKPDAREIILSKEEQLQLMLERSESLNYLDSPFKCDLCYKGFVDIKSFENHQEKHDEVLKLPKNWQSNNETEKETQKSQAPLKKNDKSEENKNQNEDSRKIPDFTIRSNTFKTPYIILNRVKTPIKTKIPTNETTASNINSDIKNSKTKANSNEQVTAPNNIFICDLCKKEYLSKSFLKHHIKIWHIIGIEQNCKNINLSVGKDVLKNDNVRENKISKNKNQHKDSICSDETQYKCSYCKKCFSQRGSLAYHVRTHTGEKPYKCNYCTKCFIKSSHLTTHVRIHTGEKPYKCSYCTKCFIKSSHLTTHVGIHTGEKPYKCSYCPKCFTRSSHLARHVRIHTGEKPYKCSYCIKCFSDGSNLANHVRTHTREKPHKCSYCTKCFINSTHLATHVRTHTGKKPYKCSYCTKCFIKSTHLAIHVRTHTGEKPYNCSYCTKCFATSSNLAKHVRTHTGEKPYKCSYCMKCFTQSGSFTAHVRTHTGEKPYKCSHCIKCFARSSQLATHVRIHTGEKPYKCSYCTKCFSDNSALATHIEKERKKIHL